MHNFLQIALTTLLLHFSADSKFIQRVLKSTHSFSGSPGFSPTFGGSGTGGGPGGTGPGRTGPGGTGPGSTGGMGPGKTGAAGGYTGTFLVVYCSMTIGLRSVVVVLSSASAKKQKMHGRAYSIRVIWCLLHPPIFCSTFLTKS